MLIGGLPDCAVFSPPYIRRIREIYYSLLFLPKGGREEYLF
jgi:hypothetical protein